TLTTPWFDLSRRWVHGRSRRSATTLPTPTDTRCRIRSVRSAAVLAAGPPRALIVDDDAPCRELAAHAVQREGLAVVEASSGTRALTLARAVDVSVVVLDLGLPDRDGLGVLRELREITDAPTLVVSADGRVSSR